MTRREMLVAIQNKVADNAEMVAFIEKELNAIESRNASAKAKRSKGSAERAEIVFEALAMINETVTVTEIIENAENEAATYSRQKVSAALAHLVEQGRVERILDKRTAYFRVAEGA